MCTRELPIKSVLRAKNKNIPIKTVEIPKNPKIYFKDNCPITITIKETIKIIKAVEPLSFATNPNTNNTGPKM